MKFRDTGIPGLHHVLGGGLFQRGLLLVSGPPGVGETTRVSQMAFQSELRRILS